MNNYLENDNIAIFMTFFVLRQFVRKNIVKKK